MTATFTERLSGLVHEVRPRSLTVGERDARQGGDLRDEALAAARAGGAVRALGVTGLTLRVEIWPDAKDGHRAWALGGSMWSPGQTSRIVAGYADLFYRGGDGSRRSYRRLLAVDGADPGSATVRLVECLTVLGPDRRRTWAETSTLYTRISRLPEGVLIAAEVETPEGLAFTRRVMNGVLTGLTLEAAGVLTVRPTELARQVCSLSGRGWPLAVGTARRLASRRGR